MGASLFTYLLESTICIGIFYLFYWIVLCRLTHFQWNRFYLLTIVGLSIVIPFIHIPITVTGIEENSSIYEVVAVSNNLEGKLMAPIAGQSEVALSPEIMANNGDQSLSMGTFILIIYLGGLLYFTSRFIQNIWLLFMLIRNNPGIRKSGYYLIDNTVDLPTFSFFNYIFLRTKNENLNESELKKVLRHETVHIKQRHTLDILFLEMYRIVFWFNPIVKYLKESLSEVHEFLADSEMGNTRSRNEDNRDYSRLIVKLAAGGGMLGLTSNFSKIEIKKRLLMLTRLRSANSQKLKFALALPLLLLMLTAFSLQKQGETWLEKHIVLDSTGEVKRYFINEYTRDKDIIKSSIHHKDGALLYYTIYEYKDGKCVKDFFFHGDSASSGSSAGKATGAYTLYLYRDTLITKWTKYTEAGTAVNGGNMEYDENNYLSRENGYYGAPGYRLYEYDELNRISKRRTYDDNNALTFFEEYEYDGKYLIKRTKFRVHGELVETHTFEKL
ncbi:MAG: M56 family metallopeptidase [Flavobacteriales bacterium]|nr:M56 family metallopeptidase [Flavobacteriales bacterium]